MYFNTKSYNQYLSMINYDRWKLQISYKISKINIFERLSPYRKRNLPDNDLGEQNRKSTAMAA